MSDVFVYDAVRTPFGKYGGALSGVRPDDLAAHVVRTLLARMSALLAGLPVTVPGTTVNRLCGSSLDATIMAARQIALGEAAAVVAGGVESMSRAPWVLPKPERPFPAGSAELVSTALGWRLVNPAMPSEWTVSLGEATEQLRERYDVSREDQDAFALRSHQAAAAAWESGFYDDHVVPVPGIDLPRDESVRADTTLEKLGALKPVFRDDGTVTAGNSSPLSDGASAALLGSANAGALLGREPLARVAGWGAAANEPQFFGFAPVEAANLALKRAGVGWGDIAIGHPLGASGTRILGALARGLAARGQRWGVAAICIGVGQGLAVVLENARTEAA